jgi:hypothetical protein
MFSFLFYAGCMKKIIHLNKPENMENENEEK